MEKSRSFMSKVGTRPLQSCLLQPVKANAAIFGHKLGDFLHDLTRMLVWEIKSQSVGKEADDLEVSLCLAGRFHRLPQELESSFRVRVRPCLFGEADSGQDQICKFRRLCKKDILDYQEVQLRER